MHNLKPLTALGVELPLEVTTGTVTLTETPDIALASVAARQGQEKKCKAHLKKLLGKDAPGPGKACLRDPVSAFWTGPDQWMVEAAYTSHEDLADQLVAQFEAAASITEQSDAWTCFDLHGEDMEAVVELLCPLNIRAMTVGEATRTSIHHLGCFAIRKGPGKCLRILGPRASAGSLSHAITTAMASAL